MKKHIIIFIGICLLAFFGRFAMNFLRPRPPRMAPVVTLSSPQEAIESQSLKTAGRVVSKYSANIRARVQGILEKKYFTEGAYVKKNQLLFLIEPNQYIIAKDKAIANVNNAEASLDEAEKNLIRVEELVRKDFVSKSQYDKALASRDIAKANYKSSLAQLSDAKLNLSYTKIKSPITGRIGNLEVTEGNLVDPQTPSLATVVSLDPVYVTFDISSKDYLELQKNINQNDATVEISLPDGTTYPEKGILDFHNNKVDELTGTIKLRATFKNSQHLLLPGQFVDTKITFGQPKNVLTLEQEFVLQNANGNYVYTVSPESTVKVTPIVIGSAIDNKWVILKGLSKEDKVISSSLQNLMPQMPVRVKGTENQQQKGEQK